MQRARTRCSTRVPRHPPRQDHHRGTENTEKPHRVFLFASLGVRLPQAAGCVFSVNLCVQEASVFGTAAPDSHRQGSGSILS